MTDQRRRHCFLLHMNGVVGVTGVDGRDRVLIEAGRGAQVDFAALGVHGRARGTSYAAPIVAARLASAIQRAERCQRAERTQYNPRPSA